MLIDGGSCQNLISNIMVHKLNLTYERYPNPYWVSWIKKKI